MVTRQDLIDSPSYSTYAQKLEDRQDELDVELNSFKDSSGLFGPFDVDYFKRILNYVANNDPFAAYDLSPFASLAEIQQAIVSNADPDAAKAREVVLTELGLVEEEFLIVSTVVLNYQASDASKHPSQAEIDRVLNILVTAYKRKFMAAAWSSDESSLIYGEYFDMFPMKLVPGHRRRAKRAEWLRTIEEWNRRPFVHPDYVQPQNIVSKATQRKIPQNHKWRYHYLFPGWRKAPGRWF